MEKIIEYINNIEQLSTDARYEEDIEKLIVKLQSIEYWAKKGKNKLKKINENKEYYNEQSTN